MSQPADQHDTNLSSPGEQPFCDAARGPRIQKVMADAGVGSRRHCEDIIREGRVTVNGHRILELPAWVDPDQDHISVDGRLIRPPVSPLYIILNKPRNIITTTADEHGRTCALDLVQHPSPARLFPVGRLDRETSGLLLLTNDGALAQRIAHPRHGVHKTYEMTVKGSLDAPAVRKLESGIFLPTRGAKRRKHPGRKTTRSRLKLLRKGRDRTKLVMELREGRNRQIRRMMRTVGHTVLSLKRTRLGPLSLEGLQPGQWRELSPGEIAALHRVTSGDADGTEAGHHPRR